MIIDYSGGERVSFGGERVSLGGERVYLGGERVSFGGERVYLGGERVSLDYWLFVIVSCCLLGSWRWAIII
ncbi:MAG: hypothetical protein U9P88_02030 [Patescibacteria group bacterium]|nr:hypothetical protein [Patescibacteria group bacterium]